MGVCFACFFMSVVFVVWCVFWGCFCLGVFICGVFVGCGGLVSD